MEENAVITPPEEPKKSKKKGIIIVLSVIFGFYILPTIIALIIVGISSCNDSIREVEETNINNYSIIFDITNNYKNMEYKKMDTFDESTYNSALLFVPREKPEQLLDFYYHAYRTSKRMKCQFYFAYKLDHDKFENKKEEIYNYKITINGQTHELIKNNTDFYYPAVIVSYYFDDIIEYILFDNDNDVIIHVFNHYDKYSMQKHANYNIRPKTNDLSSIYPYLVQEGAPITNEKGYIFNKYGCFKRIDEESLYAYSFYAFLDGDDSKYYNDYEYAK